MKNLLIAASLLLAITTAQAAEVQVPEAQDSTILIRSSAAKELYAVLKVDVLAPEHAGSTGINPLVGIKTFESDLLKINCEKRLFTTNCAITVGAEFITEEGTYTYGESAVALFEALDVEAVSPDNEGSGGINPLAASKSLVSADKTLTIACYQRFFTNDCSISYVAPF